MSGRAHLTVIVGIIGIGIASLTGARSPAAEDGLDLSGRIRAAMQPFIDGKEISGAVTLVGRAGGVVSLEALGARDAERGLPMKGDTLFRIASMTKPITAIGVLMLADEGKVAIDDPVERYLPEFRGQMLAESRAEPKKPSRRITLRDLLTHTSGMSLAPAADRGTDDRATLAAVVTAYAHRPLEFEPGSRWAYCNPGIDTLGRVIEVVSGQPYDRFLTQRLFGPLGMVDTTFDPTPAQRERVAVVYNRKDGALRPAGSSIASPWRGGRYPSPSAGLFSTAPDLARLYQMLLNRGVEGGRRYLSASSVAEMTRVHTGDLRAGFSEGIGYGLGWAVVRQPTGLTAMLTPGAYGHGGGLGTQCWIDPRKGMFTILLTQRPDLNPRDEAALRSTLPRIAFGANAE